MTEERTPYRSETRFGTFAGRSSAATSAHGSFDTERAPPNLNPPDAEFIVFYDTETSGLPLYHDPSDDPRQPHIVQVGAALVHMPTRQVVDTMNAIVRPDGWTIPDEVAAVHGITTERALAEGRPEAEVVAEFVALWRRGQGRIAFNEPFDRRILRIAIMRFLGRELADEWKAAPFNDPCYLCTPILNLPPTAKMQASSRYRNKPKTPKLSEAYEFFTGRTLEGAHDAMNDVNACIAVHFAIADGVRDRVAPPTTTPLT